MNTQRRTNASQRQGTTLVETAFVLPVLFFFLFAIIEFGHAQLVNNMLNKACRAGARIGSVEGTSSADVVAQVNQTMAPVIDSGDLTVFVNDASVFDSGGTPPADGAAVEALPSVEVSDVEPRQMFVIRARLYYNDIALVPMPFMDGVELNSQAFMRHE
ncbi:MAG: pilus assembly protein [Planctomycetes bacterium]|nr:pilus assembly protein [Planctomycetota bacterium]